MAYVAAIQELGAATGHGVIPPRPFMRPTAIEKREEWIKLAAQAARGMVMGIRSAKAVMELLTRKAEEDVADKIVSITEPPLSPVTIELRAMKKRAPSLRVTARTVGEAARKVNTPGYTPPSGVSTKPLNDIGMMIATLSSGTTPGDPPRPHRREKNNSEQQLCYKLTLKASWMSQLEAKETAERSQAFHAE